MKVDFDGILHREVWFVDELSMSRMAIRYFQTDYFDRKWIIRSIEVVLENVKW